MNKGGYIECEASLNQSRFLFCVAKYPKCENMIVRPQLVLTGTFRRLAKVGVPATKPRLRMQHKHEARYPTSNLDFDPEEEA